jgi:hypothetical protein
MLQVSRADVSIGHSWRKGAFRHKDFTVSTPQTRFRLRLVIHSGNYGFCLMDVDASNPARPWKWWRTDGYENGNAYMLVLPQHQSGQIALRSMSVENIQDLALAFHSIILASQEDGAEDLHKWQLVASLCHQQASLLLAS